MKLRNVLLWNKTRMVIISASLILPFLLRVLGVFGEGFESESAFFVQFQLMFFAEIVCNTINFRNFADKLRRGLFCHYLFGFQQQIYEKQSSFGAFIETIFEEKEELLIPNCGY